ncbi:hypothetical protein [Lichenihabitans psoromatis]|uniref:hypothetical protein n=1 Tax=Lichenihabitans psoromatis TaxID=2528642 RepID=UPI001036B649|nr:hypothetical protein [Lichenihabitans psoromatis]
MPARYEVREEQDRSCSVVQAETGEPVFLAGIPQTRLHIEDARVLAERLSRMALRIDTATRLQVTPD